MTGREYKEMIGVDLIRGLIREDHRTLLHDHALKNKHVVIDENLLHKGKSTRYRKGMKNLGRYVRSPQTMARLRANTFAMNKNRGQNFL